MNKKFIKVERPGKSPEFWDASRYTDEVHDGGVLTIWEMKTAAVDDNVLVKTYSPAGWESVTYEYRKPDTIEQAR